MKRNSKLIDKKFYQYLLPSVLMIFAMQFGSLIDGILVGNLLGPDALSASSLVMPVLYVIQCPGFALSVGGSIAIANLLGRRNVEQANKVFSLSLLVTLGASALFAVAAPFASGPLARLFAPSLYEYSYQYILVYMLQNPVMMLALVLATFISTDNNPKLSAAFYIVANLVKIGAEVLFIRVCGMGMVGAALSSGVGYAVGLVTVVFYARSKKRMLRYTWRLRGAWADFKDALKASVSTALTLLLTAVQTLVINVVLSRMITAELELVIFGLVSNLIFVFDLFSGGILGLIPTICGVLYGERDVYSLRAVLRKIYLFNLIVTALITAVIMAWPEGYSALFGYAGEDMRQVAYVLRIYLLSAIPLEVNKFSTNYYPAVNKNLPAVVTVLLREAVFIIPLTLLLMRAQGILGYSLARVITEYATVVVVYALVFVYERRHREVHGLFMLERPDMNTFDVSVANKEEEAAQAAREVTEFAKAHDVSNRDAQVLGFACEEMITNIIRYGYKRQCPKSIDVNVKVDESQVLMRIRDDGMPFDPTEYKYEESEQYLTGGIAMMLGLVDETSYMRVLNMNNTVFKINIGEKVYGD